MRCKLCGASVTAVDLCEPCVRDIVEDLITEGSARRFYDAQGREMIEFSKHRYEWAVKA